MFRILFILLALAMIAPAALAQDCLMCHRNLTPGKSNASRALPQTRTRGTAKFDNCKAKMFVEDYNLLVDGYLRVKALGQGKGVFEVSFQLTCTVYEPQLGTTRWDLLGCRL